MQGKSCVREEMCREEMCEGVEMHKGRDVQGTREETCKGRDAQEKRCVTEGRCEGRDCEGRDM